jgi:hypothetical protein
MRIGSAEVLFSAQHRAEQRYERRESLVAGFTSASGTWELDRNGRRVGAHRVADEKGIDRAELLGRRLEKKVAERAKLTQVRTRSVRSRSAMRAVEQVDAQKEIRTAEKLASSPEKIGTSHKPALSPEKTGTSHKPASASDRVESSSAMTSSSAQIGTSSAVASSASVTSSELTPQKKTEMQLLTRAIEGMSGKKMRLNQPGEMTGEEARKVQSVQKQARDDYEPATFEMRYRQTEFYSEEETTSFSAKAAVQTADGREIQVDLDMTMSRKFATEQQIDVSVEGVLKDPLVINFDAPAAELTKTKYSFDIDSDGKEDQISFAGRGSGFLALDKDGSGGIDNGTELFGAQTGNGFAELSAYDEDGNNFIDEADSIFQQLRIWSKEEDGSDQLVALGQRGLGAIYLGNIATPFSVKNEQNQLQGMVRSTGFFLRENGSAGSVQQVDLVA